MEWKNEGGSWTTPKRERDEGKMGMGDARVWLLRCVHHNKIDEVRWNAMTLSNKQRIG